MKITRKLGIGDLQHVRTQLLSIGILSPIDQAVQLQGACEAGDHLRMMMRAQVMPPFNEPELLEVMYRNGDHQILTYDKLSRDEFTAVFDTLDLIIEPEPGEIFSITDVRDGIIDTWTATGGRFVHGNFPRTSYRELQEMFPSYSLSAERYWQEHINHFLTKDIS
jgi:hypothetical protein